MKHYFLGIDIGTTTTHALVAHAELAKNCVTGRKEFTRSQVIYRSPLVFTPFQVRRINETKLTEILNEWRGQAGLHEEEWVGGGAIVTGLAAQSDNAERIRSFIRTNWGDDFVVAVADPRLESWVSFMGSVERISLAHPDVTFFHLDIGGGTTNSAIGRNGQVQRTASHFIGARHFEFVPGTYQLTACSVYGEKILGAIGRTARLGETVSQSTVREIVKCYVDLLEALVSGKSTPLLREFEQAALPRHSPVDAVTFSGGVGELIYSFSSEGRTPYGDLGVELADGIRRSRVLSTSLSKYTPDSLGRATVMGMAIFTADLSGTTSFIPDPEWLPLRDVPILGELGEGIDAAGRDLIERALSTVSGAAIRVRVNAGELAIVQRLGQELANCFRGMGPGQQVNPLVLLVDSNVGKTLGELATDWRRIAVKLLVIDEVPDRMAQFVRLGKLKEGVVPVTFYGMGN